jgi:large subunit ribosomal protein L31
MGEELVDCEIWPTFAAQLYDCTMKQGIHPQNYRVVVFKDMSNEYSFLSRSAANTKETILWEDGQEYPLIKIDVSHKSHPFYTGKAQFVDTAGRIDKFRQKYDRFKK